MECGKSKCKFLFKCFKCGGISHSSSKYTFKENKGSDIDNELDYQEQRNVYQWNTVERKKKIPKENKSLYSR